MTGEKIMNREEIADLFQNIKFREASIHFYDERRSVMDVEKLTGISRTTIYKFFDRFKTIEITMSGKEIEHYDENYLTWRGTGEKNYLFTQKLLTDWISHELNLTGEEEETLAQILEKDAVDRALRKGSKSWFDVKSKLMLPLAVILPLSKEIGFGKEFVFKKVPDQIGALTGLTKEETNEYFLELQDSIRELKNSVAKKLVGKFAKTNLAISLGVSDFRNMIMDTARSTLILFVDMLDLEQMRRTRRGKQILNRFLKNLEKTYGIKRKEEIKKKLSFKS